MLSTRRESLAALAAAQLPLAPDEPVSPAVVRRHDDAVARLLAAQNLDPASPFHGGVADAGGIHPPITAAGFAAAGAVAWLYPGSRFHRDNALLDRTRFALAFLARCQNEQGNIYLPSTNFNSPPDTAFAVHGAAQAAHIARLGGRREIEALFTPFLTKAGSGLAAGGVHTPNHRWVVCAALAQIHELYPGPRYPRRIRQWLAEGIDIDGDGQFAERSTAVYNPVTDRALITVAHKMKRPELLDPVRRNLDSMLYLVHADGELVTEISRRQDRGQRADMGVYWLPLQYMALNDGDGRFAALAARYAPGHASLAALLEYPELRRPLPPAAPLPEDYVKELRAVGVTRIRRGPASATLVHRGDSRFFALRRGSVVVNAVRFASAFFGKGQFVPARTGRTTEGWLLAQTLEAPYYQPFDPPRPVAAEEYGSTRGSRRRSEICRLEQSAAIAETESGFRVRLRSQGTDWVPLAVEIGFREGGTLEGCELLGLNAYLLGSGHATFRAGGHAVRFGPGAAPHRYIHLRGAEPQMPGTSVYLTGYTPFHHTIEFVWV